MASKNEEEEMEMVDYKSKLSLPYLNFVCGNVTSEQTHDRIIFERIFLVQTWKWAPLTNKKKGAPRLTKALLFYVAFVYFSIMRHPAINKATAIQKFLN